MRTLPQERLLFHFITQSAVTVYLATLESRSCEGHAHQLGAGESGPGGRLSVIEMPALP